jgi:pimeloyl-ACP methyl ester carboxylesterase
MSNLRFNRRCFLGLAFAAALALPASQAFAAPFASDRITVRTEGSGPDVILIPGVNSSPRTWATTVAAVPGYRYHLVQVSGFAGQPAGANKEGAVLAPVADEIARYIREAALKRPAVVGHSLGGTLGLLLATRQPDSLGRLMVVDMMPYMGAVFAPPGAGPDAVAGVADRIAAGMQNATPEQRKARAVQTVDGMVRTASMRPVAVEDSLASDPVVGAHAYREVIVTNLIPDLGKITVPVTVLYVMPAGAPMTEAQIDAGYKAWYGGVKRATLKRIPDSAHFIMWDQPGRFQQELKAFVSERD